jgi:hypothetical protein
MVMILERQTVNTLITLKHMPTKITTMIFCSNISMFYIYEYAMFMVYLVVWLLFDATYAIIIKIISRHSSGR